MLDLNIDPSHPRTLYHWGVPRTGPRHTTQLTFDILERIPMKPAKVKQISLNIPEGKRFYLPYIIGKVAEALQGDALFLEQWQSAVF